MSNDTQVDENLSVETPGVSQQSPETETVQQSEPESTVVNANPLMNLIGSNTSVTSTKIDDGDDPYGLFTFIRAKHKIGGELPVAVRRVANNLTAYIKDMQQNAIQTKETLATNQRKLWNTFVLALNSSPADSSLCLDIILFAFEKHFYTVFNERMIWRGLRDIKLSATDLKAFQFLGTLFMNTAREMLSAPNGKKPTKRALASTSLRDVVSTLSNENAQLNLTAYYSSN